jgi:Fe-S cluster assembly protein SufD
MSQQQAQFSRAVRHLLRTTSTWVESLLETWLNGASIGLDHQVVDNHTRIDHAKPNCHSFETYKSILGDHATGIFNGKIFVYEDAQKTDAKQTNQAILLSPTATFNTKPQLEIFADDVKCTHGATVGQLREDSLFYMQSRGIPKAQAQALLVYAFAAEVIEKITVPGAREKLEEALFSVLQAREPMMVSMS